MRTYDEIFALAAEHHGGRDALEQKLAEKTPLAREALAAIGDDRWLSMFSKCVFQAGFSWKVIEAKWEGFEEAFHGFEPAWCSMMSDEDIDALLADTRIVRNAQKILSVRENAMMLRAIAQEAGSGAGAVIAAWPASDYIGLLDMLKTRGSRLGGNTAQMALRFMGRDSFILSKDVAAALTREGVVERAIYSKSTQRAVQAAFDAWMRESGRSMTEVSRTLAFSVGE